MVREVLRREDYKCYDRWGEGLGMNSGSCCFLDPSCCSLWSWCGYFKGRKVLLSVIQGKKILIFFPSPTLCRTFYYLLSDVSEVILFSLPHAAQGFWCKKHKHKSDPGWELKEGKCLRLALLHASTTSINTSVRMAPVCFCVSVEQPMFSLLQFHARSKCYITIIRMETCAIQTCVAMMLQPGL